MSERPRTDPEALLAHAGWMRALAQRLLGDPGAADDVVQDATVAALRRAPADAIELEPWLARVVRNLAWRRRRGESRRAQYEAHSDAPRGEPSPVETLERLDLQRAIVDAVRAIDEPFRTTIVLRYFEGKTSAEIAAAQGVPASTVRWRLMRGLDDLRLRLDAKFGSRQSWALLIAPFAHPRSAPPISTVGPTVSATASAPLSGTTVLTGAFAMNAMHIGVAAAVLALAGGLVWWTTGNAHPGIEHGLANEAVRSDPTLSPPALESAVDLPRAPASETGTASGGEVGRSTPAAEPASAATPAESLFALVDARFVDEHGVPWTGVSFAAVAPLKLATRGRFPDLPASETVASGADGRAALRVTLDPRRRSNESGEAGFSLVASRAGCATVERPVALRPGANVHLGDVLLGAGVDLRGRVVDEHGDGVALASVGIVEGAASGELPERGGYERRFGSPAFRTIPGAQSAADGSFVIEGVAPGSLRLWAHADGRRFAWSAPIDVAGDRDVLGLEIAVPSLLATDRIEGRIVAPDGAPIAHAELWFSERSSGGSYATGTNVDAEGRFSLLIQRDDCVVDFTARDPAKRFSPTVASGVRPGTLDLEIRMQEKRWRSVHVHDATGGAILGAKFQVDTAGLATDEPAESSAAGTYSIAVPDGPFHLEVSAPGFRTRNLGKLEPETTPATIDVELRRAPVVRGRVTADGRAVAGARVLLLSDDPGAERTVSGFRCRYELPRRERGAPTDAEGRFRADWDEEGAFWVCATAKGWVTGVAGPIDPVARSAGGAGEIEIDVELTSGGAIEGRVLLPVGRDGEGRDGEGTILALNHGDGQPRTLHAGPHGNFRVDGLAPGDWQVLAVEKEIDPESTTYSSVPSGTPPIEWSCTVVAGKTTRFDLDLARK